MVGKLAFAGGAITWDNNNAPSNQATSASNNASGIERGKVSSRVKRRIRPAAAVGMTSELSGSWGKADNNLLLTATGNISSLLSEDPLDMRLLMIQSSSAAEKKKENG